MIANIPVCFVHRRISGLSFLHRRKHQSLPPHTQEVLCNVSFFPHLFQLDVLFMCCTHAVSLSLSSSFSSSYLNNAPARQGDFPYADCKEMLFLPLFFSFFIHRLSDPHAYVHTIREHFPSLLLKILLKKYTPSHRCIKELRQRAA